MVKRGNNCEKGRKKGEERGKWKLSFPVLLPQLRLSLYDGIFSTGLFNILSLLWLSTIERTNQSTNRSPPAPVETRPPSFAKVPPREKSKTLESSRLFSHRRFVPSRRKKDRLSNFHVIFTPFASHALARDPRF